MSGSFYDSMNAIFSSEGKQFQVEYAQKAVDNSETTIGVKCTDGVLMASEKQQMSKLVVEKTNKRIYNVAENIGMIICGCLPDGRNIVDRARYESSQYLKQFGIPISGSILAERIGQYTHVYTQYSSYRPFGACVFLASYAVDDGYKLHMIEPNGSCYSYYACTSGKGKQVTKGELERVNLSNLTCAEALPHIIKITSEGRDGKFEFEISQISQATNNKHVLVDQATQTQAEARALEMIDQEDME